MGEPMTRQPKYAQTREQILEFIEENGFERGGRLPTETELVSKFGVSRNTVRLAVDSLVEEGVVSRQQGRGTFYLGNGGREVAQKVVGFVNFNYLYYIYPDIVHGIEDEIYKHDYSLILSNCNHDRSRELEHIRRLVSQGIKGLIIEPSAIRWITSESAVFKELERATIPVVTTNCRVPGLRAASIALDDDSVGATLAQHLIDHGHRRVAMIYMSDIWAGLHRRRGFEQTLRENDIEIDESFIVPFESTEITATSHPAERITADLLQRSDRPSAIAYFNDEACGYGYRAIEAAGLAVPGDVSIVGVDDAEGAAGLVPGLTTVRHPKRDLGRWAARLLLDMVEENGKPVNVSMVPELTVRTSVGTV